MNNQKILSGYEIVAKGATKIEATLPELGLKDIFPNKTWLEDKQIQSSIEARKHLIEVERIDKSGALSHAEWREELSLAEVTQKVGSYWQYLGHNVGKKLFLNPEEALFLLESNNLSLKHNDVKVSLQQAYTLLLRDNMSLLKYKVYASLSRLGYRVYRHSTSEPSIYKLRNTGNTSQQKEYMVQIGNTEDKCTSSTEFINSKPAETLQEQCKVINDCHPVSEDLLTCVKQEENTTKLASRHSIICEQNTSLLAEKICSSESTNKLSDKNVPSSSNPVKHRKKFSLSKLQKLKSRQLRPCNNDIMHKYFDNSPEFLQNNTVTVKTPDKRLLPKSINLNKGFYNVNLHNIQNKNIRPASTDTNIYSFNDEVNGSHIRRLRSTSNRIESNWIPPTPNLGFPTQTTFSRLYNFWRPRQPSNFCNVNMLFQRPYIPSWFFVPNLNYFPRSQSYQWRSYAFGTNRNTNNNHRRRARKTVQKQHLDGILKLASRLKQLLLNGDTQQENIYSLQRIIHSYNTRYKTKVRLNETFDIVVDETIVDTIELDDDDAGPSSKKRRTTDSVFEDNLNKVKLVAMRLKELEYNDKSSGRHRRSFSKLLKTFNESYNEDYFLNDDYQVMCRNQIDLDTSESSDLDCVIDEPPTVSGKKLKNPFNILKRHSETQHTSCTEMTPSENDNLRTVINKQYSEFTLNTFKKDWLPPENDFGRAEIITKDAGHDEITDMNREEFLFDFVKIQTCKYDNWLELKKSFFNSIQAAIVEFQGTMPAARRKTEINSLVKPEDCVDMASVLKKLSIINSEKSVHDTCTLEIDFDVYNRDVQNFRKTNRPTPHFRIICISESTNMPAGDEIATFHSKYADNVTIVFAIVGIDSISYIQINPTDLPVYISNNN